LRDRNTNSIKGTTSHITHLRLELSSIYSSAFGTAKCCNHEAIRNQEAAKTRVDHGKKLGTVVAILDDLPVTTEE
jgi:hypothetical protein